MKKTHELFGQGVFAFAGTLIVSIIINYFISLYVYNRIVINFSVDILFALVAAIASCFRTLCMRLDALEKQIKSLEFQLNQDKGIKK